MSAYQLPLVASVQSYRVSTLLAGTEYILDLHWNGRASAWYMDLMAADESPIRLGIKLVIGANHCSRLSSGLIDGVFVVADLSGTNKEAGFDDLGTRVMVYFVDRK